MQYQLSPLMKYQGQYRTEEAKAKSSLIGAWERINSNFLPPTRQKPSYTCKAIAGLL
jgi:hypothetical protein